METAAIILSALPLRESSLVLLNITDPFDRIELLLHVLAGKILQTINTGFIFALYIMGERRRKMNKKLAYTLALPFLMLAGAVILFFMKRNCKNSESDC